MKNVGNMCAKFFLFSILFFAFIAVSGQNDGAYLNVRLYPVQVLSIGDLQIGETAGTGSIDEKKYFAISSTAGFEVNLHQVNDNDKMNIINSSRGTLQKTYTIDQRMRKLMNEIYTASSAKPDYLVLTLISQ